MHKTHELRLAKRMARLGTETAFEVLVKAKALEAQGRDIIHLEIGEPDFDTPDNIIEAGCDALRKGFTHYGPSAGMMELREVIAQHVSETRRVNVTPDEVVVVPGGKPIIFFSILALAEEGDEIIYPNPGFPIYESMIRYLGAKAVPIPLVEERGFSFDLDVFRELERGHHGLERCLVRLLGGLAVERIEGDAAHCSHHRAKKVWKLCQRPGA